MLERPFCPPKNRHSLLFEVLPKWANPCKPRFMPRFMGMERRAGAQQQRKRAAEPSHNGMRGKVQYLSGFQQNGEHDPS
jgi:hypothetical protein